METTQNQPAPATPAPLSEGLEAAVKNLRPPPTINREAIEASRERRARAMELDAKERAAAESREKATAWAEVAHGRTGTKLDTFGAVTPEQRRILAAAMEFGAGIAERLARGTGALFYGPVGTGKDHLALGILRAAIGAGHSVKRLVGPEWYGDLRDAIDGDKSERSIFDALIRPDWLLVSDPLPPFGALTPHQASQLYRLVDARRDRLKPTIVTVNVKDGAEGKERMGDAAWDRLRDGAWTFACGWSTHRQPEREVF